METEAFTFDDALAALDIALTALEKVRDFSEVAHDAYERIVRIHPARAAEAVRSRERVRNAAPEMLDALKLDDANHDAIYRFVRHLEKALDGTHQQTVADTLLELATKLESVRAQRRAAIAKAEGK